MLSYTNTSEWIKTLVINSENESSLEYLIKNLFLLQKDPSFNPDPTWNPPLWTIRTEFLCSAILPFIISLVFKFRQLKAPLFFIFLWVMMTSSYHAPLPCFFAFFVGFIVCNISEENVRFKSSETKYLIITSIITLVLISPKISNPVVYTLILSQALLALIKCTWQPLKRLLISRPLLFLGKISYSLYLLHFPVMLMIVGLFGIISQDRLTSQYLLLSLLFLLTSIITFALASLSQILIEAPFNNLGHKLFN